MRRIASAALTAVMAFSLMLTLSTTVQANAIAGGGNSSSYSGESVFTNIAAGGSGQFSAIFFNDGSTTWQPGTVGLLICAADKVTCNVASPNAAYASGWFSSTVYATVSAAVPPGSNGFFIYNFTVPAGTGSGVQAVFNGDVGLIGSGLEFRPQGYFQINTTPGAAGSGGLTITPSSASLPVGGTQQFTASGASAGATINWSVVGGCGAITSSGLFAATATNSATQPCSVQATSSDGLTGSAAVSVFGPATQITCNANPSSINNNGSDSVVISGTLKDANGNTVTSGNGTVVTFNNNTPALLTPTAQQTAGTNAGTAKVTYFSTGGGSGTGQVSLSSGSLTGCNAQVTINPIGTGTKLSISFSPASIAADGTSESRLRANIVDANGNLANDTTTIITATQTSGAGICNLVTTDNGSATVWPNPQTAGATSGVPGRVNFYVQSTTTPGTCTYTLTTNNSAVAGGSATLTTVITGAANKLAASTSGSPAPVGCDPNVNDLTFNCPLTTVTIQDANGNRETGFPAGVTVVASWQVSTVAGSGCPAGIVVWNAYNGSGALAQTSTTSAGVVTQSAAFTTTARSTGAGRAFYAFTSNLATTGCTVNFTVPSNSNISSTSTTIAFTPGSNAGLACSFSPNPIANDSSSTSLATVNVVDSFGNATGSGSYSVTFAKTGSTAASGGATTLITASPQNMNNGTAQFTVKSAATSASNTTGFNGTDTYTATAQITGTSPNTTTCTITTQ